MLFKNPFYRKPDFYVGGRDNPYMLRWHIIPRNKWFNIYLHKFLQDDEDRACHNHPWKSLSIILKGKYIEHLPNGKIKIWKRGAFIYRHADYFHRIELFKDRSIACRKVPRSTWTLFVTGRKIQEWGFLCPQGFRHWRDFVNPDNHGETGAGCD
jgi:hypothetical protein